MILFPNAKINLGLNITSRRPDGYHDISTIMIATDLRDILEIVPAKGRDTTLTTFGRTVDCPTDKNLVMKAYRALAEFTGGLPPADIYLQKVIPDGAGLGGGSADAAFTITGLNEVFGLGIPKPELAKVASTVGADCAFFIYNTPALCTGIGSDIDHDIDIDLTPYSVLIAKPYGTAVSTKEAYSGVTPRQPAITLKQIAASPPQTWRETMINDFETTIFPAHPEIKAIKELFYSAGAVYASMSGSGAAVFGIFDNAKMAQAAADALPDCDKHIGKAGFMND